jgi:hypothetical protein
LKSNTLWLKVTNRGQTRFNPPSGGGQYVIQGVLK